MWCGQEINVIIPATTLIKCFPYIPPSAQKMKVISNMVRGGPQFSAFSRAYKPYARGEGVKSHVRFLKNVDHVSWREIRMQ